MARRTKFGVLLFLFWAAVLPCGATLEPPVQAQPARSRPPVTPACRGVSCDGVGVCFAERGVPYCLCDSGYSAVGARCVPGASTREPTPTELLGRRVVDVAVGEQDRGPREVGQSLGRYPFELSRYVSRGDLWCSDFVSWAYRAAGIPFTGGEHGGWMVRGNPAITHWFRSRGRWVDRRDPRFDSYEPQPGDYVRFSTAGGGHSAIVRYREGPDLHTIEGNAGNHVRVRTRRNYRHIARLEGFGAIGERP